MLKYFCHSREKVLWFFLEHAILSFAKNYGSNKSLSNIRFVKSDNSLSFTVGYNIDPTWVERSLSHKYVHDMFNVTQDSLWLVGSGFSIFVAMDCA